MSYTLPPRPAGELGAAAVQTAEPRALPTIGLHPPHPPYLMLGQLDLLQVGALVVVLLAGGALAAALLAAWRQGGVAGLRAAFGLGSGPGAAAADGTANELRGLMSEASELAETLAGDLDARAERLEHLLDEIDQKLRQLERGGTRPRGHGPGPAAAAAVEPMGSMMHLAHGDDPITREIYRLSDQGLPPVEIARNLGQHTGKVELILALRQA